jgi:hypothetical protein
VHAPLAERPRRGVAEVHWPRLDTLDDLEAHTMRKALLCGFVLVATLGGCLTTHGQCQRWSTHEKRVTKCVFWSKGECKNWGTVTERERSCAQMRCDPGYVLVNGKCEDPKELEAARVTRVERQEAECKKGKDRACQELWLARRHEQAVGGCARGDPKACGEVLETIRAGATTGSGADEIAAAFVKLCREERTEDFERTTPCLEMAMNFRDAKGVGRDFAHARALFAAECEKDARSQGCRMLASMHEHGMGGPVDLRTAYELHVRAAEYHSDQACVSLVTRLAPEIAAAPESFAGRLFVYRWAGGGPSSAGLEKLRDLTQTLVEAQEPSLERCRDPHRRGIVRVMWTIKPGGEIGALQGSPYIVHSTFADPARSSTVYELSPLETCARETIRTWKFLSYEKDEIFVRYTFAL